MKTPDSPRGVVSSPGEPNEPAIRLVNSWLAAGDADAARGAMANVEALVFCLRSDLRRTRDQAESVSRELEGLRQERDDYKHKGERLCNWIGPLFTSFNTSTPEGVQAGIDGLRGELDAFRQQPSLEKIVRATLADFHWTPNEIVRHIEVVRERLSPGSVSPPEVRIGPDADGANEPMPPQEFVQPSPLRGTVDTQEEKPDA